MGGELIRLGDVKWIFYYGRMSALSIFYLYTLSLKDAYKNRILYFPMRSFAWDNINRVDINVVGDDVFTWDVLDIFLENVWGRTEGLGTSVTVSCST